ncbi:ATP-binding cassette domain-containing protein [Kaistia nematophila]|uniref:ATP-binding cassette domain-containing protein n=1 Tax=Kaistia nematophila TaxID=2994654 RepID=A0A9X3E2S6_9HYPH|nr:ATP-binding cassette domain-containing protein [Kaistia nematophila]MCX5570151.1 ATP-binding cassette domain-containing protein [Kaistia nematophila]
MTMQAGEDSGELVRMENIQKHYGKVESLRNVNLSIGRNEIVGLLGDNGAGKSTLIKVMTGVEAPTAGKLFIKGKEVEAGGHSVRQAQELRIETVYQDKSLGEKQPLWRNFFVGRPITNRLGFIDVKAEKRIAEQIMKSTIGFRSRGISVDSTVGKLSGGERQGVAIGRAMHFDSDLIILDEPTVALAIKEVRRVLDFIQSIKAGGRSCIYIEHTLANVHEVADRLIVLDRGEIALDTQKSAMSLNELTEFLLSLHRVRH